MKYLEYSESCLKINEVMTMKKNKLLYTSDEWTVDSVQITWDTINKIAKDELGLDYYDPQIELVTFDQMLDAYSNIGLPVNYTHWSFGKSFISNEQMYRKGQMGLAYELVINSNPAIAYCLETNTSTMQALVLSHACCGHVHFFKNNYLFKEWTDADGIINYMKYAKKYIDDCSEKYGVDMVESLLDSCHALKNYGVDVYRRGKKKTSAEYFQQEQDRLKFKQDTYKEEFNIYPGAYRDAKLKTGARASRIKEWEELSKSLRDSRSKEFSYSRDFPEENLLYFFEKKSPLLFSWEREIIRIVRNVATYFYPQRQTKVMNEGFATAIHYTIMNMLHDKGHISEGNMLEFLHSHTNVCCQHEMTNINPYALGFNMFMDLKRMCLEPTEEDKEWFPEIAGSQDWLNLWKDCVANYRDESFIMQFLSPKIIRDMHLFNINYNADYDDDEKFYEVTATHKTEDVYTIRRKLAAQHKTESYYPSISVREVNWTTRTMHLEWSSHDDNETRRHLDEGMLDEMHQHIERLWGFDYNFENNEEF